MTFNFNKKFYLRINQVLYHSLQKNNNRMTTFAKVIMLIFLIFNSKIPLKISLVFLPKNTNDLDKR
jgi:hypothetical protein